MPQIKTPQRYYGVHIVLLPLVLKFCQRQRLNFATPSKIGTRGCPIGSGVVLPHDEEVFALINAILHPEWFSFPKQQSKEIMQFGRVFTRNTNECVQILNFIRDILERWRKPSEKSNRKRKSNQRGFAIAFLRTHKVAPNERGKMTLIDDLSDGELSRAMSNVAGFEVSTDSVKKARHLINEQDDAISFWNSPEISRLMQAGILPRKPRQLLRERGKGKTPRP